MIERSSYFTLTTMNFPRVMLMIQKKIWTISLYVICLFSSINIAAQCEVNTISIDALCFNGNTGSAIATASGTTGNVMFTWRKLSNNDSIGSTASIANLFAGTYVVIIKDANGCTARDTVTINQPPKFEFQRTQDSVSCFGGTDGCASLTVTGGVPPYNFLWSNGSTTSNVLMNKVCGLDAKFHSVIVTDKNGCDVATLIQVLEPPRLVVDSTKFSNITCFGGQNGSATVFASGGTQPIRYAWTNTAVTSTITNLKSGIYTVTVTDHKSCTTSTSITLNQPNELIGSATNIKNERCFEQCNGEVTLTVVGGNGQYQFEWNDPKIPSGTNQSNTLCPADYQVTITDDAGCKDTLSFKINAAIALNIQIGQTPPTCVGQQNGSLTTNATGGNGGYTYLWSNGRTTANLTGLPCGSYSLTLTDASACTLTTTVFLSCPDTLRVKDIITKNTRCFDEKSGSLEVVAMGGTGNLRYQWNDPANQQTALAIGLGAGTYNVTITDSNNCNVIALGSVDQPKPIAINLLANNITCFAGADGKVNVEQITGGNGNFTFLWSNNKIGSEITDLTVGTYTVTATDALGCTNSATSSISRPDSLSFSIAVVRSACSGENNAEISASAKGGNGTPYTYLWSNGSTSSDIKNLAPGTYTLTVTDAKSCSTTGQAQAFALQPILINITNSDASCFGVCDVNAAINKITGGAGNGDTTRYTYQWSIVGQSTTLVKNICGGLTYTVTATDALGCTGTTSVTPPNPPAIDINTQITNVSCFGANDGKAKAEAKGSMPILIYEWEGGQLSPEITGLAPGRYVVRAEDIKGCEGRDTVFITEPQPINLRFMATPLRCSGDLNAQANLSVSGGTAPYKIDWDNGEKDSLRTGLGPGDYVATVTDKNGCTAMGSINIPDPDSLAVNVEITPLLCFGDQNGRIRLVVTGGQIPYRYSLNNGPFDGSSAFFSLQAGVYELQVRDNNGCTASISAQLIQPPRIEVNLGADTCITLGDSLLLSPEIANTFGRLIYSWRGGPKDTLRCLDPDCSEVIAKPQSAIRATLIVADERGCFGTGELDVCVKKPRGVYVPTGFSPNGDTENDRLVVHGKGTQIRRIVNFKVYDRWGELLYEDQDFMANDASRGWDGSFRGSSCLAGVYIWRVEVEYNDGFKEVESGQVTLIR